MYVIQENRSCGGNHARSRAEGAFVKLVLTREVGMCRVEVECASSA